MRMLDIIPQKYQEFLSNYDCNKEPLEQVNPNIINTSVCLLEKFFIYDRFRLGANLKESINALGLEGLIENLPGIDTEKIDVRFLKSLFNFKGTKKDLEYLLKLTGIRLNINEYGNFYQYNDNIIYKENNKIYNQDKNNLSPCQFSLSADIDVDNKSNNLINLKIIHDILFKILKQRIYFCTSLLAFRLLLIYQDELDYKIDDKAVYDITRTFKLYYGRGDLIYKDNKLYNTFYKIYIDPKYGDKMYVYNETVEG